MKKLKYIIILVLSLGLFNSCLVDDTAEIDQNDSGYNVATFVRPVNNLTGIANGDEYTFELQVEIVGPTMMELTNDIEVAFTAASESTAEEGVHYRIENPVITLTNENNYLGKLVITLITEGNTPPLEGDPAYEHYEAPMLYLDITTSGDANVVGSGKGGTFTLNFIPPNPYAGIYDAHVVYWHPDAGGDYPPSDGGTPYSDDYFQKELLPITARKCETLFAIESWTTSYADLCWITVNADNSIAFEVADTWDADVSLGDPYDASKESYFDPATGVIHLYYHYYGAGGARVFWETLTPTF